MHKKILLVTSTFPNLSESFIVSKFVNLSNKNLSIALSCDEFNEKAVGHFPILYNAPNAYKNILRPLPRNPTFVLAFYLPLILLTLLITSPKILFKYLSYQSVGPVLQRFKNIYLDYQILRYKPNIIHFEFGTLCAHRHYLKNILNCKIITSFRGFDLNVSQINNPYYYKRVWEVTDQIHVLSNHLSAITKVRGCPANIPVIKITPAININKFTNKSPVTEQMSSPFRLLSVGRLDWRKGYEYTFQALKILKLKSVNFRYQIIGEGPYFEALTYARYQLDLFQEVEFLGAQSSDSIINALGTTDVFLHNALTEGFCNAVIEAQAMGVPVICSNAGGLPENILNEHSGLLTPCRDVNTFLKHILHLYHNPSKRKQMGKNGNQRVLEMFDIDKQTEAFSKLYTEMYTN